MRINCAIIDKSDARAPRKYDELEGLTSSRVLYGLGRKGGAKLPFRDEIHQIIPCFRVLCDFSEDEARRAISNAQFELLVFADDFNQLQYELLCAPFTIARFSIDETIFTRIEDFNYKHERISDAKALLTAEEVTLVELVDDEIVDEEEWVGIIKHRQSLNRNLAGQLNDVIYDLVKPLERCFNNGWTV